MPELIRLYVRNVAIGFLLAVAFVALLLGLNVANLRHLVLATEGGFVAVAMLVVFNGIVFAGVQFGMAVMRLAEEDGADGGGRGDPLAADQPVALPVRSGGRSGARSGRRREPQQP